jgi:hypothetical protein
MALLGCGALYAQTTNQVLTVYVGTAYTIPSVAAASPTVSTYQWLENGRAISGATATAYTNSYGKPVPGRYEYVRQAKPSGCSDYISSNPFVVEVISNNYAKPPSVTASKTVNAANQVWSSNVTDAPYACAQVNAGSTAVTPAYILNNSYPYLNYACYLVADLCPFPWRKPNSLDVSRVTSLDKVLLPFDAPGYYNTGSATIVGGSYLVWTSSHWYQNEYVALDGTNDVAAQLYFPTTRFLPIACVRDM